MVLGHIQRGGKPVPQDRILATRMGNYAVKLLLEDKTGLAIGIIKEKLVGMDILKATELSNNDRKSLIQVYKQTK